MGQGITPEQRKRLKEILARAEPYAPGDPELEEFNDRKILDDRMDATIAKQILDENPE